jgi:serine/threonine-protein kinase RsbW
MKSSRPTRPPYETDRTDQPAPDPATASDDGLLLRLELHSDPRLLCAVRGALERLAEVIGLSAEDSRAVTRAIDEALTNIVRHAYSGRPDGMIEVSCNRVAPKPSAAGREGLEFVLCDHGPAVDPAKLRGRSLADVKPGGLGLHLIRQSMDEVQYRRVDDTNEFRLVKYFVSVKRSANP